MPTPVKVKYTSEDEIPDIPVRELFEKRGDEYLLVGLEGVKTEADVARVQRALSQEREARRKSQEVLDDLLSGRKPEEVKADLDRIPELEAAGSKGTPDEEKIHQLVEARIKTRLTPLEREKETLRQKTAELEQKIGSYEHAEKMRGIREELTIVARKAKVAETAIEDVVAIGERLFDRGEDGRVVTQEGVTADVWLTDMAPRKPHWWGPSVGGGARPGSGEGIPNNPWTKEHWNTTRQGQLYRELGKEKAERLARAAGSAVGATRPPAK